MQCLMLLNYLKLKKHHAGMIQSGKFLFCIFWYFSISSRKSRDCQSWNVLKMISSSVGEFRLSRDIQRRKLIIELPAITTPSKVEVCLLKPSVKEARLTFRWFCVKILDGNFYKRKGIGDNFLWMFLLFRLSKDAQKKKRGGGRFNIHWILPALAQA